MLLLMMMMVMNPFVDLCFSIKYCGFSEQYSVAERIRLDQAELQNPSKMSFKQNTPEQQRMQYSILFEHFGCGMILL